MNKDLVKTTVFAGNLAHFIRNPLAGINAQVQLLQNKISDDNINQKIISSIFKDVNRLNDILKMLLKLSNLNKPYKQQIDIIKVFNNLLNKYSDLIKSKNLNIIKQNFNQIFLLNVNKDDIVFCLKEILLNAIEASNQNGEIYIIIEEKKIIIQDTGIGIKEDDINFVFEPFYTTKKDKLGLGLSFVKKIVLEHESNIAINSNDTETIVSLEFY